MNENIKQWQLSLMDPKSYLTMLYQTEFEQGSLFKFDELDELSQAKHLVFKEFIDKEAKKRNTKPLKLIEYFSDHIPELTRLLEGLKGKKIVFKNKNIYLEAVLQKILHEIYKPQKLINTGKQGLFETWEGKGVQYLIPIDSLPALKGNIPKVSVSQHKNMNLLMGLTQEQQYYNDDKRAECKFTFSYYAERRGYTKEEIQKGGKFYDELRRDLLTGAITTYKIDKIKIEGKNYTRYGIPNLYMLDEPADRGGNYIVTWNEPYHTKILDILNNKKIQHFRINRLAIEDRHTSQREYLYRFYLELVTRKQLNLFSVPVKVRNLLISMQVSDSTRPKECFEILKECLIYFSTHYEPVPEIESYNIYNDFHKTETLRLPLSITEAFQNYTYESYKGLLKAIGIKDIKQAFISFKRPYTKPKAKKTRELNDDETRLLERTLKWFENWNFKIPRDKQDSMIRTYIKKLGYDNYLKLYEHEADKPKPNGIEFLIKVLPDYLKEYKAKQEK